MSEAAKRKIDDTGSAAQEHPEAKKPKQEIDDDDVDDDLNFLKTSIVKEVTAIFEGKFTALEKQLAELKQLIKGKEVEHVEDPKAASVPIKLLRSETTPIEKPKVEEKPQQQKPKATFGSSLFVIKPNVVTPANSFSSDRFETPTAPNSTNNTPRPVFGATTSFGKPLADTIKGNKNVFDALPSQAASASSFGSNSKFGNAFQESLKKKSFLDESSTDNVDNKPTASQQFKQVDLEQVENVQTGEEDEESLFSATAKIFELDLSKISEGWKERGLGPLHLNQTKSNKNQARLVMRSQGLLRVVLNYKITPETQLLKGLEASLTPEKFVRLNSARDGHPIQYLIKFGSEQLRDKLVAEVEEVKKEIGAQKEEKTSNGVQWL